MVLAQGSQKKLQKFGPRMHINSGGRHMARDYRALVLDATADALVATTLDGRVQFWNRGATELFGYTSEEAAGKLLTELTVPLDRLQEEQALVAEAERTGTATAETVRHRKDGSLIYLNVSLRALRNDLGELEGFVRSETDVTRLRLLRESRMVGARYGALLESMPDAILILNDTGRIVLINARTEAVFGHSRDHLIGQQIELLLPERFRGGHAGHRVRYFTQPRAREMGAGLQLYGLRSNGEEFPVEISLSPLRTDEGPLVISAIRDITDRKRVERTLQEKNVELERASRAKDQFLATMSHELRTPLNAIIGFTGTLLMQLPGPLTTDQDTQLRTVQSSAKHLLSLINDLLDLAKIESGKVEIDLQAVPVAEVMREVCTSLQPAAQKKSLTLTLHLPDAALTSHTDRRSLSQILINLTNNAIKFTEQGEVRLEAARGGDAGAPAILISVVDTGIGIRQEDQARLFEAFGKIARGGVKSAESTGLGLHLSRKLAELLGGKISLSSSYGSGSRFTLSLPEQCR
jgi:PAS domain S-box-containing protein